MNGDRQAAQQLEIDEIYQQIKQRWDAGVARSGGDVKTYIDTQPQALQLLTFHRGMAEAAQSSGLHIEALT